MQPGQFLVRHGIEEEKIEIIAVCGKAIGTTSIDRKTIVWQTEEVIKSQGWSLLEEPWVPGEENYVYKQKLIERMGQRGIDNTQKYPNS